MVFVLTDDDAALLLHCLWCQTVKNCSRAGEQSVCLSISRSPLPSLCLSNCGNRVKALKRNLEGCYQQGGSKTETASETGNNLSVQPSECMVIRSRR